MAGLRLRGARKKLAKLSLRKFMISMLISTMWCMRVRWMKMRLSLKERGSFTLLSRRKREVIVASFKLLLGSRRLPSMRKI